jgi:uncharacterized protein YggE
MIRFRLVLFLFLCALTLGAQQGRRPFIRASGDATVSERPDLFEISVGTVTQAQTAQQAAEQNAAQLTAVIAALRQLLGQGADIRTAGFSLSPNYRSQTGGPPVIVGYTASNSIQATVTDLSLAGRVIDTAAGAGANSINGLRFTLKNSDSLRAEALRQATRKARGHAEAIAQGLGVRLGQVFVAEEGGSVRVLAVERGLAAGATPTPIEPGAVEVQATVTIEAEILP